MMLTWFQEIIYVRNLVEILGVILHTLKFPGPKKLIAIFLDFI